MNDLSSKSGHPRSKMQQPATTWAAATEIQHGAQRLGLNRFAFLATLGRGNFGKVMLAEIEPSKKLCAVRVLRKELVVQNDEIKNIRAEKKVFQLANQERHPFLATLYACFQTETDLYFAMEFIGGGNLLLRTQQVQLETKHVRFYAAEICSALQYLHRNGIVHRNLKLNNVLLAQDGHIKIADYGFCKDNMQYGSTTSTFCGTAEFMAPEVLLDKPYGVPVDWWAFGVIIYEMLLRQPPFAGEDEDEIYDAMLNCEPLYPSHLSEDSALIIQGLLIRDPDHRLGSGPTDADEVMCQPFFHGVDWEGVYHKSIEPPFIPTISNEADMESLNSEMATTIHISTPASPVLSHAAQEEFRDFSWEADQEFWA